MNIYIYIDKHIYIYLYMRREFGWLLSAGEEMKMSKREQ